MDSDLLGITFLISDICFALNYYYLWYLVQYGWLEELQLLGYKDPLPILAHVGIQVVIATIE